MHLLVPDSDYGPLSLYIENIKMWLVDKGLLIGKVPDSTIAIFTGLHNHSSVPIEVLDLYLLLASILMEKWQYDQCFVNWWIRSINQSINHSITQSINQWLIDETKCSRVVIFCQLSTLVMSSTFPRYSS
jgi:hypothetical protein